MSHRGITCGIAEIASVAWPRYWWQRALHPLRGDAPVTWQYTRSERVQCLRIGCNAYGSGVPHNARIPQRRVCRPARITHRQEHTKPQDPQAPPVWRAPEGSGGPGGCTRERRGLASRGGADTTASQISHVIYRGHFSRYPKNVAIPTTQMQCLNESSRNYVRNWWLAAIAGHQGNAPSNISREGPTGVEGAGGTGGHKRARLRYPAGGSGAWPGSTQTPRPIGGRREACGAWPGFEPTRRAKLAARTASGRAGRAAAGDLSGQQSATRCADGSRAGRRPRAHQAARPDEADHATPGTPVGQQATPQRHPQRHEAATGFPATASSRSRSAVHNGATSDQAVMST